MPFILNTFIAELIRLPLPAAGSHIFLFADKLPLIIFAIVAARLANSGSVATSPSCLLLSDSISCNESAIASPDIFASPYLYKSDKSLFVKDTLGR